jgi:hypothetical protein
MAHDAVRHEPAANQHEQRERGGRANAQARARLGAFHIEEPGRNQRERETGCGDDNEYAIRARGQSEWLEREVGDLQDDERAGEVGSSGAEDTTTSQLGKQVLEFRHPMAPDGRIVLGGVTLQNNMHPHMEHGQGTQA